MPTAPASPRRLLKETYQRARAGSSAAAHDRRFGAHPFTGPVLARREQWERLTRNQQRLLGFIEAMPRECGVSAFTVRHACRVLRFTGETLVEVLDELNAAGVIFFFAFELGAHACYAVKPHAQHGDTPLSVARRVVLRLELEGRA